MPRRYATYQPQDGFTWMNQLSTVGAMILGVSMLPFIFNVYITARTGKRLAVDDPWGFGHSLEWATSCPPPRHNFTTIPRIRSESPAFDLNHPETRIAVGIGGVGAVTDAPDTGTYDAADGQVK